MHNEDKYTPEELINKIREIIAKLLNKPVEKVTEAEIYLAVNTRIPTGGYDEKTGTYWNGSDYLFDDDFIERARNLDDYLKAGYDIPTAASNSIVDYNDYISTVYKYDGNQNESNNMADYMQEFKEKYPMLFDKLGNFSKNGIDLINLLIEQYTPQLVNREDKYYETVQKK